MKLDGPGPHFAGRGTVPGSIAAMVSGRRDAPPDAYDKLLAPLVAKSREQMYSVAQKGYARASATSVSPLRWWFETEHLVENADGSPSSCSNSFP